MKKLIGTLVAAMLAAAVFADVGVGAWGRGIWAPIAYDGDVKMVHGVSWGGAPRVGVSLGGSSDNVGFAIDLKADGGNIAVNDNAFIWVKPWDFLKIQVGQWFDDTLRGSGCFVSWDWLRPGNAHGDDLTFARIYNTSTGSPIYGGSTWDPMRGVLLSLTPIEGLYIAAGLNTGYGARDIVDVFKTGQYQAAYTIADIMAIKAQYIGATVGGNYCGIINAAVDLLMIEGSKISVGAFIPTSKDEKVAISATYNGSFDALSLSAYVLTQLNDDFLLDIGVGVGYDLGDGMAIEADVRADMIFASDPLIDISVGAYFSKGFSNGKCGVGVIAEFGVNRNVTIQQLAGKKVELAVPVKLEYWF